LIDRPGAERGRERDSAFTTTMSYVLVEKKEGKKRKGNGT
jgi:hypothetical protein